MSNTVACSFDLNVPGKQTGYLKIGDSTNNSGWATFHVPIICISNGTGPTVLVLGGNHGDEYEGQFAAADLAHSLEPSEVQGRVIIIPCLSQTASKSGTRLWPDGTNFNRIFPGDENGGVHAKLAFYLSNDLFPISDAVIELHSGGRGHYFIPCSHMVWSNNPHQRQRMLADMASFNTSHHLVFPEQPGTDPTTLLPGLVERMGKGLVTTELGGAGVSTFETTQIAKAGLRNALHHFKVLTGPPRTREEQGLPSAKYIDLRGSLSYHHTTHSGLYENVKGCGDSVSKGDVIGYVHDMDHPDTPAVAILAQQSGVIGVMRGFPRVKIGDVVAVLGPEYSSPDEFPALG
jgi:predicted deacylase